MCCFIISYLTSLHINIYNFTPSILHLLQVWPNSLVPDDLVEDVCGLVQPVFTHIDILLLHALGPTSTVGADVHHTAPAHNGLQGDDLIQGHTEHLIGVELAVSLVERLMGPQVVVAKRKPLITAHTGSTGKLV